MGMKGTELMVITQREVANPMVVIDLRELKPKADEAEDIHDAEDAAPRRIEKPHAALRVHRRPRLQSLEKLPQYAVNRYEGVLIAAARARQLNAKKTAMEERGMEEALDLKKLKMTSHALAELLSGQIQVTRPGAPES